MPPVSARERSPSIPVDLPHETSYVHDDQPLRQGDIFVWLDGAEDPWRQTGIVVTADCDIAQAKHGGVLTYVPVLPLQAYLCTYYLPRRLRRGLGPVGDRCLRLIKDLQARYRPDFPTPLSNEAVEALLEGKLPHEIAETLKVPAGPEQDELFTLVSAIRSASAAIATLSFDEHIAALRQLTEAAGRTFKPADLGQDVRTHVGQLPGDAFFIGAIPEVGDGGFVAYLRLPREVRDFEVAVRQPDLRNANTRARRICRLNSPYVFRLTQQLGGVFADIGLPRPYEANRDRLAESTMQGTAK